MKKYFILYVHITEFKSLWKVGSMKVTHIYIFRFSDMKINNSFFHSSKKSP